ncbi:MAG: glutamate-5-semialdehyde dehydrogenase [Pseudanabaenaceae cyanobacterium]
MENLRSIVERTQQAGMSLGLLPLAKRNQALLAIAQNLEAETEQILRANAQDVAQAQNLPSALVQRLKLDLKKIKGMVKGLQDLAKLPDPLNQRQIHRELDENLVLQRLTCPIGVIGVIFEARPDALVQIAALAVKSGNGAILKGGSEALNSCQTLMAIIHRALQTVGIDPHVLELVTTRAEIMEILQMDDLIDLIVPRGSNEFVRYIQTHSRIPVMGHADGICHVYIDRAADLGMAVNITVDSKVQYPAACNAIESLLVHQEIAPQALPLVVQALREHKVEVRGCALSCQLVPDLIPAQERDWTTEYLDLILSVKIVPDLASAIDHINRYGSHHTEAIVTEDIHTAQVFQQRVNACGVYHNCSTRFADGFRYGFGAEVGISTQKLPPRGPVGLEGLVTYKYWLTGKGQIVADYTGENPRPFTHRDLPT